MVDLKMNCDLCSKTDLHEVFILRSYKFSQIATKKERKFSRVCWGCARHLFRKRIYNFGHNWRMVFLDDSTLMDKNKAKYMVIHA